MSADTSTPSAPKLDVSRLRRLLEHDLSQRQEIVRQAGPSAAPNVDPVTWATSTATRRVLEQITAALTRLDDGTYGRCLRCGERIAAARLEVLPHAENCLDCQRRVDGA